MILHGDVKVMAAFVKARGEMAATVAKDKKGNYGQYATLAALTEATSPALSAHGCAIVQEASLDENGVMVETWLVHESGGMLQFTPLTMPVKDRTAQSVGSAITYARRYALAAVCGIAPDDDDADAATHGKPAQAQQPTRSANAPQRPAAQASKPADTPAVVTGWKLPADAKAWAVEVGASENEFAANVAFKRLVDEQFEGKVTRDNVAAVYAAWYDDRMAKLSGAPADAVQQKFDAPTPEARGVTPTASAAMRDRIAAGNGAPSGTGANFAG